MEDRLSPSPRGAALALAALAALGVITASWWALALWPLPSAPPDWLVRTRLACFGTSETGLPDAGGWIALIASPLGVLGLLLVVWGDEVRAGLRALTSHAGGQLALGITAAALAGGAVAAAARVSAAQAQAEPFIIDARSGDDRLSAAAVNDPAPALALVDQAGEEVTLSRFGRRPVLVTFAFAHCETVCPVVVHDVLSARDREPDADAAVLIVTLDPWRDTPARLPAVASAWGVTGDAHVLSGAPEAVEATLTRWRIPRTRNAKTGDVTHPSVVYVVKDGRIRFAFPGGEEAIRAALRSF
ncbi:MAG TPA: SCO family protein [Gemmatimonadales bacterium]|nr:SCO family protein [Gemmatimonadales bacterium]